MDPWSDFDIQRGYVGLLNRKRAKILKIDSKQKETLQLLVSKKYERYLVFRGVKYFRLYDERLVWRIKRTEWELEDDWD